MWYLWLCVPRGVWWEVECGLGSVAVGPLGDGPIQVQGVIQEDPHVMQVHTRCTSDQVLGHTQTAEEPQGHREARSRSLSVCVGGCTSSACLASLASLYLPCLAKSDACKARPWAVNSCTTHTHSSSRDAHTIPPKKALRGIESRGLIVCHTSLPLMSPKP